MAGRDDAEAPRQRARDLLDRGEVGGVLVRTAGRIAPAVAVLTPEGVLHSWFVPVGVGDRLAGFFQFLPDLTMLRYASFQRQDDSIEGCPETGLWLDEAAIQGRFRERAGPGDRVGPAFLTFDRTPSRLAWAAVVTAADGRTRTLFAAGRAMWEAAEPAGESFGGAPPGGVRGP